MICIVDELDALPGPCGGLIGIRDRFPTLGRYGIAAERFNRYVNFEPTPHRVDVVLLTCIVAGRAVHQMEAGRLQLGPGSVGIALYGQAHHLITGPDGVEVVNVYLDLNDHPLPVLPPPLDRTLWSLLSPHPSVVGESHRRIDLSLDPDLLKSGPLPALLREQAEDQPGQGPVMRMWLSVLLVECVRAAQRSGWISSIESGQHVPGWIAEACRFLDKHYEDPIGLADLTRRAGVSAEHLCRRFKRCTGQSPLAYLTDRRLQAAMWQLRTTPDPVTAIAHRCGFSELSYFNRRFKAATGLTPTHYRRRG